jgi:hypothetical protein
VLDDDLIRSCRGALDCTPFFRQNRKIHPCTIIYAWLNFVSQLRKQSNPIPELSKSTRRRSLFPSGRLAISGTRTRYTSMNGESSPIMGHTPPWIVLRPPRLLVHIHLLSGRRRRVPPQLQNRSNEHSLNQEDGKDRTLQTKSVTLHTMGRCLAYSSVYLES